MSLKACLLRYWPDYLADMIGGLKSYSNYRPSGVTWVGEVPDHWSVVHLRYLIECLDGRRVPLSSEQRGAMQGGIPYWGANSVIDLVNDWLFDEPLVLLGEDGAPFFDSYRPVCFFTSGKIWVNNHAHVLRCSERVHPEFLVHALNSVDYISFISGSTRDKLTQQAMGAISIQLPPLSEQAAIVSYLEHANSRVWRYISAKERLIELLTEQKQAIINQAVTRGLDSNVHLKPSGVEWLGYVPAHWEVLPIKRAFISMDYGISESSSNSGSIRLLTMGNINEGRVAVPQLGGVASVAESLLLRSGDLLFNRTNSQELVGKVGLFTGHETPVTFASYLVRLRTSPQHRPEYLNTVLNDVAILAIVRREAIPSLHQSNLNPTRYGRIRIPLPPLIEQVAILEYLGKATEDIDASIDRTHRQIELMHEYRTRLIADVVTGKLDIRGVVADEVEVPPP